MMTKSRLYNFSIIAVFSCFACPGNSDAGIVVTTKGRVFRGRIRRSEIDDNKIRMRWPYKNFRGPQGGLNKGLVDFEARLVRWYHPESDELTDEYFKKHASEPLESRFKDVLETWRERQRAEREVDLKEIAPIIGMTPEHKLLPLPQKQRYYEINKPRSWATKSAPVFQDKGGQGLEKILMMVSTNPKNGYAARIHVISVPRPKLEVTTTEQRRWYHQEIRKLIESERFEVKEKEKIQAIGANKKDVTWVTVSRISKKGSILALRAIRFRQERVYFVTCYAHEEEFADLRKMFERCISTMLIYEDQRGG